MVLVLLSPNPGWIQGHSEFTSLLAHYLIYLLAYDHEVVHRSLKGIQEGYPDEYLEKIVQVSFDLPVPMKWDLRRLFFQEFSRSLPDAEKAILNNDREAQVMEKIATFLDTPRKIKRFVNAYRISYPVVYPEVNPVDFAGIEIIRILRPPLYHYIQRNEEQFITPYPFSLSEDAIKGKQQVLTNAVVGADNPSQFHEAILNLIRLLFPGVNAIFDPKPEARYLGLNSEREERRERRICVKEYFSLYFRWSLPDGAISSDEFDAIFTLSGNTESFRNELKRLENEKGRNGESRLLEFLKLLHARIDEIPNENIKSVLLAFAREGDAYLPVTEGGIYYSGLFVSSNIVEQIFLELLGKVPQSERIPLFKAIIENGTALLLLSLLIQEIGYRVERRDPADPSRMLTKEQFDQLSMLIDARFQDAADDGSLLDNPGLYHILTVWMKTSPDSIDRIKDWATTSVADRKGVAKFIGGFYRLVSITDSSGTSIYHQIEFNLMKQLIDPFSLEDVAKQMSGSQEITDHQRKALKDFSLDLELSRKKNRPLGDDSLRDT